MSIDAIAEAAVRAARGVGKQVEDRLVCQLATLKDALAALQAAQAALIAEHSRGAAALDENVVNLNAAREELDRRGAAEGALAADIEALRTAIERLPTEMPSYDAPLADLGRDLDDCRRRFDEIAAARAADEAADKRRRAWTMERIEAVETTLAARLAGIETAAAALLPRADLAPIEEKLNEIGTAIARLQEVDEAADARHREWTTERIDAVAARLAGIEDAAAALLPRADLAPIEEKLNEIGTAIARLQEVDEAADARHREWTTERIDAVAARLAGVEDAAAALLPRADLAPIEEKLNEIGTAIARLQEVDEAADARHREWTTERIDAVAARLAGVEDAAAALLPRADLAPIEEKLNEIGTAIARLQEVDEAADARHREWTTERIDAVAARLAGVEDAAADLLPRADLAPIEEKLNEIAAAAGDAVERSHGTLADRLADAENLIAAKTAALAAHIDTLREDAAAARAAGSALGHDVGALKALLGERLADLEHRLAGFINEQINATDLRRAGDRAETFEHIGTVVADILARQEAAVAEWRDEIARVARAIEDIQLLPGPRGRDGCLPPVIPWRERLHRTGEVVSHAGGTWQARRDTEEAPGAASNAWEPLAAGIICAEVGDDGHLRMTTSDGNERDAGPVVGPKGEGYRDRGQYRQQAEYEIHDVVTHNGSAWCALADGPLPEPPGPQWRLMVQRGERGSRGPRGIAADPATVADHLVTLVTARFDAIILPRIEEQALACAEHVAAEVARAVAEQGERR